MSAADKPSEYLKRTCLICGCNTNQTINIYEPRGGPNIVQLIQAKFKFQPLNEDKYLCFSCNNWLINWHSLQANNSNDAESPSGTFRSSQVNGGMAQEKRANPQEQQQQQPNQHLNRGQEKLIGVCRPIAQIRPQQILKKLLTDEVNDNSRRDYHQELPKKTRKHQYAKRRFNGTYRLQRIGIKCLSKCCGCGCPLVLRTRGTTVIRKPKRTMQCRKCRQQQQQQQQQFSSAKKHKNHKNIIPTAQDALVSREKDIEIPLPSSLPTATQFQQCQSLRRPLVDGKVVAMLRRLGTTLSRQSSSDDAWRKALPPIMSPAKPKPQWTRQLEDDEIPLHFDTTISEVLPIVEQKKRPTQGLVRRKLTYQIVACEENNDNGCAIESARQNKAITMDMEMNCTLPEEYQNVINSLPRGLNISLI